MPGLRELQLGFSAAVLRQRDAIPLMPGLHPADERLARRLTVYRVNARENFAAALEAAYPVLRRQLGAEDFRSLAWSYQQEHPSLSGNLYEAGRQLPVFLASTLPGTGEEHLRDIARLEWAVQESMVAADSDSRFEPQALAAVPASQQAALHFGLHPSVRLLQLEYPVFHLWRDFHAPGSATPASFETQQPGLERVLVRRSGAGIELHQLDAVEHCCLACLFGSASLGEMTDAALEISDAPDIAAILVRWAARGVITQLRVDRGQPP